MRTAKKFGVSRTTVSNYTKTLINEGLLVGSGKTNARKYILNPIAKELFSIEINQGIEEDVVWRFRILPHMAGVKQNVVDICQYGFTEMLNNVIDHSRSKDAIISFGRNYSEINIGIIDHGVGIFEKLQHDFNLADPRSALLELSKGKLTSNQLAHSGEGIFYTSRMFEKFNIMSGHLFYAKERTDNDGWLIETHDLVDYTQGTSVQMYISTDASWTTREVFDRFQTDGLLFRRTHVPITLGKYPGEQLVSRSQAKRILARFENFSEVMLDFRGIQQIGQPFADEIFRVFKNSHPQTRVVVIHANEEIKRMIEAISASEATQPP
ncbi:MAG TPA: STAS-like domain-containing protein [Stellaceae bacterium]|nr:STAS-like domain-containing protein [Stellaceae bacterium]